jgi:GxxExxY protein
MLFFAFLIFAYFACFAVTDTSDLLPFFSFTIRFRGMTEEILFKEESYKIVGACFEVYREKGCGFVESVYQECMEIELRLQGIPFVAQRQLALEYKSVLLHSTFQPDLMCFEKIVVELKAVKELADEHRAQVQNYLKAARFKLGLLVNFGHYPQAEIVRIAAEQGRYRYG